MNKLIVGVALTTSLLATIAFAEEASPFSSNVSLTTNYKYRGQDQGNNKPAIQGGFDFAKSGFYIGNWNSSIGFTNAGIEMDFYGGYKGEISKDLGFDVGVLEYYYPQKNKVVDLNTTEIYGALSYSIATAKLSYVVSNRYFGAADNRGTMYLDVGANYEFAKGLTANAHVGYTRIDNTTTYGPKFYDYKLGATYDLGSGFSLAGAVVGANKTANPPSGYGDINKARLIVTLTRSM
jgi:uncharacterized protein (TIGR02001 family)